MIKLSFAIGVMAGGLVMFIVSCSQKLPVLMGFLLLLLIFMELLLLWIILPLLKDRHAPEYSARKKIDKPDTSCLQPANRAP